MYVQHGWRSQQIVCYTLVISKRLSVQAYSKLCGNVLLQLLTLLQLKYVLLVYKQDTHNISKFNTQSDQKSYPQRLVKIESYQQILLNYCLGYGEFLNKHKLMIIYLCLIYIHHYINFSMDFAQVENVK
eukprot:TRINITY_DN4186_c1_g2_i3.p5 TRINITY_DN4186_c1_g2~~TRINITY_DN4186_c1_g2_i3.p5  ORF type:complete len:129 (+),score=0.30 TRINITY_DN4186_c1_g2_i3:1799-2185(+)